MNFTKMHGLGNDFIVVAGEKELPAGADQLCDPAVQSIF